MTTSLSKKIDEEYASLLEHFAGIVKASTVQAQTNDIGQAKVSTEMVEVLAGNFVEAAGTLMALLHELKLTVAAHDHAAVQQVQQQVASEHRAYIQDAKLQVCKLQAEVAQQEHGQQR